jgi:small-conductance mechanosensitive channel
VTTRDGREVLIPNEEFVTQRVINRSYSKDDIRLDLTFSVDVANDPHHVQRTVLETVVGVPRVLKAPLPACHFMSLTARSMDFSLRFWINDPIDGSTNVKSAVLLALWDAFKREAIDFPSHIQDMRLHDPVRITMEESGKDR